MTDDGIGIILILLQEVIGPREGYLVDVFVYLFCRKSQATVGHSYCILVYRYMNGKVTQFTFKVTHRGKCLKLLGSINGI